MSKVYVFWIFYTVGFRLNKFDQCIHGTAILPVRGKFQKPFM